VTKVQTVSPFLIIFALIVVALTVSGSVMCWKLGTHVSLPQLNNHEYSLPIKKILLQHTAPESPEALLQSYETFHNTELKCIQKYFSMPKDIYKK
jgi:hypothetical protein